MSIYMQWNGGQIKGNVTEDGHKGWIALNGFEWGVGRDIASPTGSGANREGSAPSVTVLTISKSSDSASNSLLREALKGQGAHVVIDFCKTEKVSLIAISSTPCSTA